MPLQKTVLIATIGVPASFHRVRAVSIDLEHKQTAIQVASYFNAEVAAQGAQAIGTASVQVDGVPAKGDDLAAYCERVLAAPMPEGVDPATLPQNRFVFADAEIVAS
jgi:hypothetical protein